MPNEETKKEIEVKLDEPVSEKEIEVPQNPLETLTEQVEKEEVKEEVKEQPQITKNVPPYSDDLPYSEKVRKRIQKEVAKRAEAEQRIAELEDRLSTMERKTIDIASKSLTNQYSSISQNLNKLLKKAILKNK